MDYTGDGGREEEGGLQQVFCCRTEDAPSRLDLEEQGRGRLEDLQLAYLFFRPQ